MMFGFFGDFALANTHNKAATVNINTANAVSLASLRGLGPKKAQSIVTYRMKHGRFKKLADLTGVRGIGEKFITRLQNKNSGVIVVK